MTVRAENLPEHRVQIRTLADAHDLAEQLINAGARAATARSVVLWASAEQAGRDAGVDLDTKVAYRKLLRAVLEEGGTPCPPVTSGPRRSTRVAQRIPGLRKRFRESSQSTPGRLAA